jgi:ribosome-binding ATPase YchF (GTP1/OBG family)
VKGASQGEGLGNQFLANIRETDAIVHVVRCFDDDDVLHVMGSVDPVRDREVIEFELALADLATVEKRLDRARRTAKTGDKDAAAEVTVLERAHEFLKEGRGLWEAKLRPEQLEALQPLSLLTIKPILYAANVTDAELTAPRARTSARCARPSRRAASSRRWCRSRRRSRASSPSSPRRTGRTSSRR